MGAGTNAKDGASIQTLLTQPDLDPLFLDKNFKKYFAYLCQKLDQSPFSGDPFLSELAQRKLDSKIQTLHQQKYASRIYVELSSLVRKEENLPQLKSRFRIYFSDSKATELAFIFLQFADREGGSVQEFFNALLRPPLPQNGLNSTS